ncbi:hypothetical protein [Mesorhizobium sp. CAU 1741]|uniref:hypothetical protein n=1 Tax=Mesorhizobium sp. CAU 1741 TaxID=3140366 RepID=UPI00325B9A8D
MRWLVRLLLLPVLVVGVLLGFVYPFATFDGADRELGTWRLYAPETGFENLVDVPLSASDAPVRVTVDMQADGFIPREDISAISLVVWGDGDLVMAAPLYFTAAQPQGATAFREVAGTIDAVDAERYRFAVLSGEVPGLDIASVDVVLHAGAEVYDESVAPIGYVLTVIGLVGLGLSFRRRSPQAPDSPRWGRG